MSDQRQKPTSTATYIDGMVQQLKDAGWTVTQSTDQQAPGRPRRLTCEPPFDEVTMHFDLTDGDK